MNTFGNRFRLTDFGESHGPAMGGVIDGVPAGFHFDLEAVQKYVDRRRPGTSPLVTPRNEDDKVEFLSGLSPEGVAYGTPIGFIIRNKDARPEDYSKNLRIFRPNHADYTYFKKYGDFGLTGGGRSSARQTVCRMVGGAFASQILASKGITIHAYISRIGRVAIEGKYLPDIPTELSAELQEMVEIAKAGHDSVGGMVSCRIKGVPVGIGEPIYHKLHARLADAMMGINGVKGFEYGIGMEGAYCFGTEARDLFFSENGKPYIQGYNSGGIMGGISNGQDILFSVAFKPTPTFMRPCPTVDFDGNETIWEPKGRHDPCIALRGVYVVEAMAAMVLADYV